MDELTLLRSVRDDVETVRPEALTRGREALLTAIASPGSPGRSRRSPRVRRRRTLRIAGGAALLSGVAAVAIVGNVGVLVFGGASPAAADTLRAAADTSIHASDPVVRPGQYLEISTHAAYAVQGGVDGDTTTYLESQDERTWVPSDRADEWVLVREPRKAVQTFGKRSEEFAAANGTQAGWTRHAAEGDFFGPSTQPSESKLATLPRNPTLLLGYIYTSTIGQGTSRDGEALVWIGDLLRSGVVPADLRASLYQAAAKIPGVTQTAGRANLDGRTGVAIGRDEGTGLRQELIVDPTSGELIGEREVITDPAVARSMGVPNGTAIGWTAVTTRVVDSAPSGPDTGN